MDWASGHLNIIVGTGGGAFANTRGTVYQGFAQGGGCSRLELNRTQPLLKRNWENLKKKHS